MEKFKRSCVQELPAEAEAKPEFSIESLVAVTAVHHHRMSDEREMLADLVFAPGFYFSFDKAAQMPAPRRLENLYDFIIRARRDFFLRFAGLQGNADRIAARRANDKRQIFFLRFGLSEYVFKRSPVFFSFAEKQNAGRVGIQAVQNIWREIGIRELLLRKAERGFAQRNVRGGNGKNAPRLIHRQQVFVFINDS